MKLKTVYVCTECGAQASKWMGKCPHCGRWNTLTEEVIDTQPEAPKAPKRTSMACAGGESKARIRECFDAATCEMEGAAIAHACYLLGTPVAVIRSISDLANGESPVDFPTFVALAAKNSSRLVQRLLLSLSEASL
jgi:nucleoside phosphorylase